jgi:hypothetical protein
MPAFHGVNMIVTISMRGSARILSCTIGMAEASLAQEKRVSVSCAGAGLTERFGYEIRLQKPEFDRLKGDLVSVNSLMKVE